MSAPEATEDPELQAVAWDLDPAARRPGGRPRRRRHRDARRGPAARRRLRRDPLRQGRGARRGRARGRPARARDDPGAARPGRLVRDPQLLRRYRRSRPRRAAAEAAGGLDGDRDQAAVLRARVGRARGRACRGAARHRRARLRAPPPAHRPPLPAASALGARGEDPRREGAHRPHGLDAAVRGAGVRDHRPARGGRRAGVARDRALAPVRTRPRHPPPRRRARDRGSPARPAHARLRAQHAARRQDGRGPAAPLRALAGQPQPRQRGLRRVGRGADHRRPRPLRAPAPLVPAQGTPARARQPGRLRPHGRGHRRAGARRVDQREGDRPQHVRRVLGRARRARAALLRRVVDRRAGATQQARRRLLRLHRALLAPVRAAQLHLHAARRAHARARARARRARGAGRASGHLPHGDPAHDGRDRERVRRDAGLRAPARPGGHGRVAPGAAGREHRGLDRHRLPPGGDEPLRTHRAHRAPRARRAGGGANRRAVGGVADRAARRRGRGHRGLPLVVVIRPALHQHAGLRLRLRLRPAAGAGGLRPLRGAGRELRARLPGPAQRRRLAQPRGAGEHRRRRPRGSRLLGPRARHRGAPARRRRGRGTRGAAGSSVAIPPHYRP